MVCTARFGNWAPNHCDGLARYHELSQVKGYPFHPSEQDLLVYVIGLVTMLALSAAYNMWPVSPAKWVLRRFEHFAIYPLIATRRAWRR